MGGFSPGLTDVKKPELIRVKLCDFAGSDVSVKGVSLKDLMILLHP